VRLLETVDLRVDESALTVEYVPVHKGSHPVDPEAEIAERRCMAYMGTVVTGGWGLGVVTATGRQLSWDALLRPSRASGRAARTIKSPAWAMRPRARCTVTPRR
jgi:magnesium-transporting ATPase (P-type)